MQLCIPVKRQVHTGFEGGEVRSKEMRESKSRHWSKKKFNPAPNQDNFKMGTMKLWCGSATSDL
jgi:hypothetical protein